MQMALAIEHQRNMLEAHYLKASMTPPIPSQQNSYISTRTDITQQSPPQKIEQWLTPSTTTITPQTTNSVEEFCSNNMASLSLRGFTERTSNTCSMYEPQHVYTSPMHSTQGVLQINDNNNCNMVQGFIAPYMTIEQQSAPGSSTTTTQQQLQLNNDCLIHDSFHNPTFIPNMVVPSTTDSLHQGISNITVPFPDYKCNSYPPYNSLEVVQAQLDALQNSSTSRETTSHETNLSPSVTGDDVDPVDRYIDWGKVEEMDFELDPVEVLEALGFGV
ncbi:unnamed protein product [Microthlaspi erraticum]|uniref:Uncharacterized protein n=1 Tax=Microthlaspi erraticum TaxID=1685480 RepID=A0A6D2ICH0_9BRAS|nr:unnamed protein product [Microthlaspi erraticum]